MSDTTLAGTADYAYGRFIVANRWLVIAASLLAVVASAYGMQFLQMNPDSRVFFSKDNPQLQALEQQLGQAQFQSLLGEERPVV